MRTDVTASPSIAGRAIPFFPCTAAADRRFLVSDNDLSPLADTEVHYVGSEHVCDEF
jgi:hypothetical protein